MPEDNEDVSVSDLPLWSERKAHQRLSEVCAKHNVPVEVLTELVALQRERQHQERAAGVYARIEEILGSMD